MFEKELELIAEPIRQLLRDKLNQGFKNRQGKELASIESLGLIDININEEKSSFKEIVEITSIYAQARIWVHIRDGISNDTINLSLSKPIILEYDNEKKEYVIQNSDELELVDRTY